ncbi:hypothetical protein D9F60_17520 [Escherichia coli]|jgi:hypothetical protein|nr:hypothetical protein C3F37_10890 [Salmonella enterica subsp. enterica serovar Senftenberg]EEW1810594.1 hypothetical protein [Escherichia coli]MGI20184.1 hypothetical protein [Escherichia coli]MGJ54521.1 hypothetical protein [Escherichia coli]MHV63560.1 hypothetical protein [Escherichia coli]
MCISGLALFFIFFLYSFYKFIKNGDVEFWLILTALAFLALTFYGAFGYASEILSVAGVKVKII